MEMKDRFIQLRREKQMTQAELAEALNVSRQAVSRWETGASIPSMDSLIELSKLYDVPVDYFMGKAVPANNPAVESSGSKSAVDSRACYMSRLKNALIIILAVLLVIASIVIVHFIIERNHTESPRDYYREGELEEVDIEDIPEINSVDLGVIG